MPFISDPSLRRRGLLTAVDRGDVFPKVRVALLPRTEIVAPGTDLNPDADDSNSRVGRIGRMGAIPVYASTVDDYDP